MDKKNNKRRSLKIVKDYILLLKKNNVKVCRAYLYGSQARGDDHPDSDIDVAVVLDEKKIDVFDEQIRLMKLRRKIDNRIEPHPFLSSDFHEGEPLVFEIQKNGIEIKI